jgi:RimJ/RimL family protein N-acetyltransferase
LKYRIVRIAEHHIASYHAALDRVARERKYFSLLEAPPLKEVRKFVRGIIRAKDLQFVALAGGVVVGWCDIVRARHETMRHCGTIAIGVVPEHRGRGIGRDLVKRAIATAWRRRFTRIELLVREDNSVAIVLYRSLGFEAEGTRQNAVRVDGRYYNMLAMALLKDNAA